MNAEPTDTLDTPRWILWTGFVGALVALLFSGFAAALRIGGRFGWIEGVTEPASSSGAVGTAFWLLLRLIFPALCVYGAVRSGRLLFGRPRSTP